MSKVMKLGAERKVLKGTKVSLNGGTHMRFPIVFSKRGYKNACITGQACFEIEKESARLFVVSFLDDLNIEALGIQSKKKQLLIPGHKGE